jgi:hypothetical protein
MGMSDQEMTADDIMDYLESAMVNGWLEDLVRSDFPPWADAYEQIQMLEDIEGDDDILNDEDTIDHLSRLSDMDYDTFKEMWDRLTNEQKNEVLDSVIDELAFYGIRWLFNDIAYDLVYNEKYNKDAGKVVEAAKDYLNKRIDYIDLMDRIADVFWPTEEDKKSTAYEDFMRGAGLADYIDNDELNEIIKEYLVEKVGHRLPLLSEDVKQK